MAHRSGRVIDTDALLRIFLVLHVMAKSASRVPRIIQMLMRIRADLPPQSTRATLRVRRKAW
jgi:enoyl-CoA hydratase/carnithine racemase